MVAGDVPLTNVPLPSPFVAMAWSVPIVEWFRFQPQCGPDRSTPSCTGLPPPTLLALGCCLNT